MNWPEKYSLPLFYNMLARKMLPGFRACRSILGPVAFLGWLFISGFPAVSGAFHGHDAAASVTSNLKSSLVQANEQFVVAKKMIEESVNHGNGGKDEHLPVGLRNLRNTCYMNAVLQCLFSVRQFSLAITMKAYKFKRDSIGEEVQDLFLKMDTPSKSGYRIPIRPQTLAEKLEINVDEQEDASELMLKILNELDESVVNKKPKKSKRGKNNQPVSSSSPECHNSMEEKSGLSSAVTTSDDMSSQASESIQTCHQMTPLPSSTTVAEELDLPPTSALKMEIHQSIRCIDHDHVSSQKVDEHLDLSVNIKGCRTIEDAIREYFTPELLNGENQYKCEKHGLQDAEKSLKIKKLPRVLAVHLKRFSFDPETYQMKKVSLLSLQRTE
jgi:ubiquitin carboxyl-terminal hydrolase 7